MPDNPGDPPRRVWAEEAVEEQLMLQVRRDGKTIKMKLAPSATFDTLLRQYCAEEGGGIQPSRCVLRFDGDVVQPKDTPLKHDLEEDDLLELEVR